MNGSGDAADKFQSTPSAWRETCMSDSASISREFQSTPSAWRETPFLCLFVRSRKVISIHSLRMEGDRAYICCRSAGSDFNPLPPHGGRLQVMAVEYITHAISIHSLRMEGDSEQPVSRLCFPHFNPLPPHGGRPGSGRRIIMAILFQSTPSAWRETCSR